MHTYAINQPIRMTSQDLALLESATNSFIHAEPTRTRITCDPHDFSRFSACWNSYRDCLVSADPINRIRDWRKGLETEILNKFNGLARYS